MVVNLQKKKQTGRQCEFNHASIRLILSLETNETYANVSMHFDAGPVCLQITSCAQATAF